MSGAFVVVLGALLTVIILLVGLGASFQQTRADLRTQVRELERLRQENQGLSEEIRQLRETSATLNQIKDKVFQINQRRLSVVKWAALPDRGGGWIARIDRYLARTPLAGQGRNIYVAATDAGIEPRLIPAIAMVESGAGRQNANTNNFFGRRARRGWMAWPTKEAAIRDQAFYIARLWGRAASPYHMKGYATSKLWPSKVAGEMARI